MARFRFMPLGASRAPGSQAVPPGPVLAISPAAAGPAPSARPAKPRKPPRPPVPARSAPGPVLALAAPLAPGRADWLPDAVMTRVLGHQPALATVVLDLGEIEELDGSGCAALQALCAHLRARGVRLRLAASAGARERCRESGLADRLGGDAIHASLRTALLAAYAALPGPGLVTSGVRTALTCPAEPILLAPPPGERAHPEASPAEDGASRGGDWWTVLARILGTRRTTSWLT